MLPTATTAGAVLSGTLLTDTSIRLKLHWHFVLYTVRDIEALDMLCHKCEGLAIHSRSFVRCLHCGEYLFSVEQPAMPPRAYPVDWAMGIATVEAAAFAPVEDVAVIVPKVPSAEIATATVPVTCPEEGGLCEGFPRPRLRLTPKTTRTGPIERNFPWKVHIRNW